MKKRIFLSSAAMILSIAMFIACESVVEPESSDTTIGELNFDASELDSEITLLKTAGVEIDSIRALFSLSWHEKTPPRLENSILRGNATAVAFDPESETFKPNPRALGLDMGVVTVQIDQTQLELHEFEHDGGVRYSLFPPMFGRFSPRSREFDIETLPFVRGGVYTFEASGTQEFQPLRVEVEAPTELVKITNHSDDETIDASSDLTVTWSGDVSADHIALVVAPALKFGPHHGPNFGRLHDRMRPIFEHLEAGATSYTLPAATLQEALSHSNAGAITVHVSLGAHTELTNEQGGKIIVAVRTGDEVRLKVE